MKHLSDEGLTPKSRKNIYAMLGLIFELARTFDFIESSPIRPLLHRPSILRSEKPTLPRDKGRDFLNAIPDDYKPLIAVLILTGMRQGELIGLLWQGIDFKAKMIHKRNMVYRSIGES